MASRVNIPKSLPSGQAYASVLLAVHGASGLAKRLGVRAGVARAFANGERTVMIGSRVAGLLVVEFERHVESLSPEPCDEDADAIEETSP